MQEGKIRPICLGLVRDDRGRLLFDSMADPKKSISFLRPIGGGIEFGESIEAAIKREFYEEIGIDIVLVRHIKTFENIFEYDGKTGHEFVCLCEVRFSDPSFYQNEFIPIYEGTERRIARWYSQDQLRDMTILPPQIKECVQSNHNKHSAEQDDKIYRTDNYFIVSGCSGGGKSTLVSELKNRGFQTVDEPGRALVAQQLLIDGSGLPWENMKLFLDLALARYVSDYLQNMSATKPVFFDRAIVDSLAVDANQGKQFSKAAEKLRYNEKAFLLPPWPEIFVNDLERRHNFEYARAEYDRLLEKYTHYGYEIIEVPMVSVDERADFLIEQIGVNLS